MPNIKSAEKRVLVIAAKTARNRVAKSSLKTSIKKVDIALANGDNAAADLYKSAQADIDKAASRGILHKNTAARRKSRLAKQLKG